MKKYITLLCVIIALCMCVSMVAFGDSDYELPKIPLTGDTTEHVHDWTDWAEVSPAVAATCTTDGSTAVEMRVCTKDISHTETRGGDVIPATGHSLIPHAEVPATETQPGTEAYWECETCHALFSDSEGENEISQPVEIPVLDSSFTVTGTVKVAKDVSGDTYESYSYVAGATVDAVDANGDVLATTTTDGEGKFSIAAPSDAVAITIVKYCVPERRVTLSGNEITDYPVIPVVAIDYDSSGTFNAPDKAALNTKFAAKDPDSDLDGSGTPNTGDKGVMTQFNIGARFGAYSDMTL